MPCFCQRGIGFTVVVANAKGTRLSSMSSPRTGTWGMTMYADVLLCRMTGQTVSYTRYGGSGSSKS